MADIEKIPEREEDLAIISKLGDNPNADNGLTGDGLKGKFDEAGLKLKDHLNLVVRKINSLMGAAGNFFSGGNMLGPINMNGQPLRGLNEPTENTAAANKGYVDKAASRASSPRNLLDNSDFRNPVNQRGITASSGRDVYTFDRWLIDSSGGNGCWDVKPNEGCGLNVNGDNWMTFVQKVAGLDRTKPYTIAFQDGNGTIHVNESADIQWDGDLAVARIILHTGAMTVVWAALYEGEYTAETLPEYQPKGYAVELMECLRYYRRKYSVVGNGNSGYAAVNFEIPMRVVPTVSILSTNNGAADYYEAHHEYMAVQNVTGILNLILYEASADL